MPTFRVDITVSKNDGLVITSGELVEKYFYGALPKRTDGTTLSDTSIESFVRDAQATVETELSLVFQSQYIKETAMFEQRAYSNWVFTKTTYPVAYAFRFEGFISTVRQISYPLDWVTMKKEYSTRGEQGRHRRVNLVPGGATSSPVSGSVVYAGIVPHLGFMNIDKLPDYWKVAYASGFTKLPDNIIGVVAKKAAITVLSVLGDVVLGAGVSGKTLSIDGLSQSVTSHKTDKYGAYGPRIQQFQRDVDGDMKALKSIYRDMTLAVC